MTDPAASPPGESTPPNESTPASNPDAATPKASDPATPAAPDPEAVEGADAEAQTPTSQMPDYKGEPLDAERGPGLGCFWIQIGLLTFFLVFTPLTVTWGWPPVVSAALLIFTLILLLFSGQTIIFLLRLVAVDRRARRTPLDPSAKPTVGQLEDAGNEAEKRDAPDASGTAGTDSHTDTQAEDEKADG